MPLPAKSILLRLGISRGVYAGAGGDHNRYYSSAEAGS
jgi:hypothetical protein